MERLEDRVTPSALYVDLTPGGTVDPAAGSFTPIGGTQVDGLTVGTNLFTSVGAAVSAAASGDKIFIANDASAYAEASGAPVSNGGKSLDFLGVGSALPVLRNDSDRFFQFIGSDTQDVVVAVTGLKFTSDGSGGGIAVNGAAKVLTAEINTSVFQGNGSDTVGGAVAVNGGTVTIRNSSFVGNSSGAAGVIEVRPGATLNLVQSTLAGNTGGTALTLNGGSANLTNVTIAQNSAGALVNSGTLKTTNSLFAANTGADLAGVWVSGGNNLFSKSPGLLTVTDRADMNAGLLQPVGDNGGPTPTVMPTGGNPAIDGGDGAAALAALGGNSAAATDQRGAGYRRFNGSVDIGAVEAGSQPQGTGTGNSPLVVGVNEGTFNVSIPVPAGATLVYFTLGGTAVPGKDYTNVTPSPIRVTAGQTTVTVTGTLIDKGFYAGPSRKTLTVTYAAPTADAPNATATTTLTITSKTTPQTFPGLTPAQQFVQRLYQTELGRTGSVDELAGWAAIASTGPTGINQVVIGIQKSIEGTSYLAKTWYSLYLGRQATKAEASFWGGQLRAGATEEQVLSQILSSREFYKKAQSQGGTGTADERYVKVLFQSLMGRVPSAAEIGFWVNRLPTMARTGVTGELLTSREFRERLFTSYYNRLLHRDPDAGGLAAWLKTGLKAGGARRAFESTPEFTALS